MKKDRTYLQPTLGNTTGLAPGQVPPLDWTNADEKFANYKAHWTLPFVLSNYGVGPKEAKSPMAVATGMYGPPDDELRYAKVFALIFQHFPEIKTVEFYNERRGFYGYGFAGNAAEY